MLPIILDNTKRKTFRQCKKKYFLQHVKGMQSDYGSTAIRYGVAWHGAMEGYYTYILKNGWPESPSDELKALESALILAKKKWDSESSKKKFFDDYRDFNTLVDNFQAYLEYFKDDRLNMKIIGTETKFEVDILPENDWEDRILRSLPAVIFTGRIDLAVLSNYQNWLLDFKTTGWILDKVILEANRSPQLIGYSYAGARKLNFEPNGCLCSFSHVGAYKSKKTGEYGSPKFDFRRVPQVYHPNELVQWKADFIDTCRELNFSINENYWPERFDSCYTYGACPYLKLCKQQESDFDSLNLEGFHEEFWDVLEDGVD